MVISFVTLGCKVNQYETQAMEKLLHARGHTTAETGTLADAVVINTCAVTGESARKSRQAIRKAKKQNPSALIVVGGCFAQADAPSARELGADFIGGAGERMQIVAFLDSVSIASSEEGRGNPKFAVPDPFGRRQFEELPAGETDGRTRALLKVQDGCTNFCAYCIIPYLRGPSRSLPVDAAVRSARELADQGFAEIVVTGIEISSYGADIGSSLGELIEALCRAVPDSRIHLGSLEPTTVIPELVERMAALPNLCPHFHLSLQSGSAGVLKRMRRKYDPAGFLEAVSLLRGTFEDPAITTDLIVGFPGETEEEFRETLTFVRSIGFAAMHVFPYSKREGTKAAGMQGHLPNAVKASRASIASEAAVEMRSEYLTRQTGRLLHVLFESESEGSAEGHTENYLPTIVTIHASEPVSELRGRIEAVQITGNDTFKLFGERIQ